MKSLVFASSIMFPMLFFSIISLIGYNYMGAGESSVYAMLCILVNIVVLFFCAKNLITRRVAVTKPLLLIVIGQILLLLVFMLESPTHEYARSQPMIIYGLSMPMCYVAYDVAKSGCWRQMVKWFDIIGILITIGIIINIPTIIISKGYGDVQSAQEIGNINYQLASYNSAFAYSLNLVLIAFGNQIYNRFWMFKTKMYSVISVFLLVVQIGLCLMSGGRGGAVVMVVSTVATFMVANKRELGRMFFGILFSLVIGLLVVSVAYPSVGGNIVDIISKSTQRTFSYISSSGIDMSATSNRDIEYSVALECIGKSPIIGHGIFRYLDIKNHGIYPHNFFLEILLQGGVVLLLIVLMVLCYLYDKYKKMVRHDKINIFLFPFIFYTSVMLMFSGSYLVIPLFWFLVIYMHSYNLKKAINQTL